jgi:hypothetical protein
MKNNFKSYSLLFLTAGLILIFNNCATFRMDDFRPNTEKSYIFGSFYQKSVYKSAIGLVLEEVESGRKLQIDFSIDLFIVTGADPVFAFEVEPGRYRISKLSNTENRLFYQYGNIYPPKNLKHFLDPFEVKKGSAVYIGDYTGYSRKKIYHIQWGLYKIADNFAATSEKLRKKYRKWGEFPLVHAFAKKSESSGGKLVNGAFSP